MSNYFNYFPKTVYTADSKNLDLVKNITSRFNFQESFKENSAVSYEYDIQESDTPEIISSKFYGDSEKHWIVLSFNDIVDPQFDWPMDYRTLNNFIDKKYSANTYANTVNTSISGLSYAKNANNTYAYYKTETRTTISTNTISTRKIEIDANTYANVASSTSTITIPGNNVITIAISKEKQTYYDHEIELNESKRKIKLLKPEFVDGIDEEFRRVIA